MFLGKLVYGPFRGIFWGASTFLTPKLSNCHKYRDQKGLGPFKISLEMANKVICQQKNNSHFQNQRYINSYEACVADTWQTCKWKTPMNESLCCRYVANLQVEQPHEWKLVLQIRGNLQVENPHEWKLVLQIRGKPASGRPPWMKACVADTWQTCKWKTPMNEHSCGMFST